MTVSESSFPAPAADEILRELIRFDTTNPPGNEKACIDYIKSLMDAAGFETRLLARDDNRPNLIARMPGKQEQRPLLMYGHVDVVPTVKQNWQHPPFGGDLIDGEIWGRGALDMKSGVAMMIAAMLKARAEGFVPAGDIVFAALSDEEAGGDYGARFLVDSHPELFENIKFAVGEFGAASMYIGNRTFYPVQVSEKQICWIRAIFKGPGGHGSMPVKNGAMTNLGRFLQKLDRTPLPVRITPVVRQMIEELCAGLPQPAAFVLRCLLNPRLTDLTLALLGDRGRIFRPLLRNTVSPTIVSGGEKVNVIPSEITLHLDGRIVPGSTPAELVEQLGRMAGRTADFEILRTDAGPGEPDMGMFDLLSGILRDADPGATPVPMLLPGVTDARFFSLLGIQTYGFNPLKLPRDFNFFSLIHNADERVPADAVKFGSRALFELICRYGK